MALTDKQKAEALDMLKMFNGDPPHNTPSNIYWGDSRFANSLKQKYDMDLDRLAEQVGYRQGKRKRKQPNGLGSEKINTRIETTRTLTLEQSDVEKLVREYACKRLKLNAEEKHMIRVDWGESSYGYTGEVTVTLTNTEYHGDDG